MKVQLAITTIVICAATISATSQQNGISISFENDPDAFSTEIHWSRNAQELQSIPTSRLSDHTILAASDQYGDALATGDFNGDGAFDLAIRVQGQDAVSVRYGTIGGVFSNIQLWTADSVGGAASQSNEFGSVLAAGDFNSDGKDDLAISVVGLDESFQAQNVGGVHILYGTAAGLSDLSKQLWTPQLFGFVSITNTLFGSSLTVGDFDADGVEDLAVGASGTTVVVGSQSRSGAGAVHVLYGTPTSGIDSANAQYLTQETTDVLDSAQQFDQFGWSMAAGDFNGDGSSDLAIGVLSEDVLGITNAGAVNVLYGSSDSLVTAGNQFWSQGAAGILEFREMNDRFGQHLAAGDFNADGFDDLVVGVAFEAIGAVLQAGIVHVIYGSDVAGLSANNNSVWSPADSAVPGGHTRGDAFGWSLTTGDFDGDGADDLMIGAPGGQFAQAPLPVGFAIALYGSSTWGINSLNAQRWDQDVPGIEDEVESQDRFGWSLASGDFDADGYSDVAVGTPYESVDGLQLSGLVHTIPGSLANGLTATGSMIWTSEDPSLPIEIAGLDAVVDGTDVVLSWNSPPSAGTSTFLIQKMIEMSDGMSASSAESPELGWQPIEALIATSDGLPNATNRHSARLPSPGPGRHVFRVVIVGGEHEGVGKAEVAVVIEREYDRPVNLDVPYPNPTSGRAVISVASARTGDIRVTVSDILGREVGILFEDQVLGGDQVSIEFDARALNLSHGVYFIAARAGFRIATQRIVVTAER